MDKLVQEMVEKIERRAFQAGFNACEYEINGYRFDLNDPKIMNAYYAAWRASRNEELKDAE